MRLIPFMICLLLWCQPVFAAVDLGVRGKDPVRLEDVYHRDGIPFVAIDDVLPAVGLSGYWDDIKHIYRIRTSRGWAEISPASGYLKLGGVFYPIKDKPRFIDGRLRVTDSFVQNQLAQLAGRSIYFRNLDPQVNSQPQPDEGSIDRLFSFLLRRKPENNGPLIRAVAVDPGHGGLDTGVLGQSGVKEKQLNLEIARKIAKQIKMKLGIPVYLSRDGDYDLSMKQRLEAASRDDVDVWVLVHAEASFSPSVFGANLFIRPGQSADQTAEDAPQQPGHSLMLADEIALALRQRGVRVNGIYPSSRLSLGQGELPTVLLEVGYLSHSEERQQLQDAEYQNQISEAVYDGIRQYATLVKEQENETKQ